MYFKLIFMTVAVVLNSNNKSWKKLKDIPPVPKDLTEFI